VTRSPLTIALPKGRVLRAVAPLLRSRPGSTPRAPRRRPHARARGRSAGLRFLLLKPDDVPTYVEYGAADLGVCGRDVCSSGRATSTSRSISASGDAGWSWPASPPAPHGVPRVATKYPRIAAEHFARRGVQAEVIHVQGSVELAPVTGLADLIVDLVETGATGSRRTGSRSARQVARVSSGARGQPRGLQAPARYGARSATVGWRDLRWGVDAEEGAEAAEGGAAEALDLEEIFDSAKAAQAGAQSEDGACTLLADSG
jgi:ATP phosphoribosyltransferase